MESLNEMSLVHFSEEMQPDERSQLAESFLVRGETRLLKGDISGLEAFDTASKLDSSNPKVFYRQGLALFEYGSEEGKEKILLTASKKLKKAVTLDPRYFEAWHLWGNCLSLLGKTSQEHHYFVEAEEKFRKALALSAHQASDLLADLYWNYGVIWARIADHSGEALDLQLALDAFQKAASSQEQLSYEFWKDFGNTSLQLARRINDIRLYVKAINCFKQAISTEGSSSEGWSHLAHALHMLYVHTHDEDHFSQANECFSAAVQLCPQNAVIWLNWAKFLCVSGRRNQDVKRLRSCIEKCNRSYECDPNQPLVMGVWAESLSLLGELCDRIDLIYEAQNKISEVLEQAEGEPEIWYSCGMCLNSFGNYFNDIDYYYQAIEKFQEGLSIDRTLDRHWHAIGKTYAMIAQIEADPESFERAFRFFNRAISLNASSFYIFDYALALAKLGEMTEQQKWLEQAVVHFEQALSIQKNAIYLHPEWLFHYACSLDLLGNFHEEDSYYVRAIEILSHVLMIDPDFPHVHHRLALAFSHMGELMNDLENFYRALHHFRLAAKHDEENDQTLLDWGLTLINIAEHAQDAGDADQYYREAEHKLTQAAKLGNLQAYYHLGCLYSLLGQYEKAMRFMEKSDQFESLPPLEEILQDDWLDGLKGTPDFREFLAQLEKRPIPDSG